VCISHQNTCFLFDVSFTNNPSVAATEVDGEQTFRKAGIAAQQKSLVL
jgi:hypothetical protein